MQLDCYQVEILISKSVDGEATPEECAVVDSHIAGCDGCACKLTSYMEMAAVFSEAPIRTPDQSVRSGVFTEIHRLKEADRRAEEARTSTKSVGSAPRISPIFGQPQERTPVRKATVGSRIWSVGSPFVVMGTAVAALLVIMTLATPPSSVEPHIQVAGVPSPAIPGGVGTKSVASVYQWVHPDEKGIPSPVETRGATTYLTASSVSATVHSTATFVRDRVLKLSEPTAVMEEGNPDKLSNWHALRDPAHGYSISYPPNWWTQVRDSTRYFYPWGPGGVRYAPYWIELHVEGNPKGYNVETADTSMFGSACDCNVETGVSGSGKCLRRSSSDGDNFYDELYMFDPSHIYRMRVKVPLDSNLGDFQTRWQEVNLLFARMSGSMRMAPVGPVGASGYGPVLFLNGSDLWAVNAGGSGARPITRGYVVQQFVLTPDLRHVVFSATNNPNDRNAETKYIYVVDIEGDSQETPQLLSSSLPVYDIALNGDRAVLAIGKVREQVSGIYTIPINLGSRNAQGSIESVPQRLTVLSGEMAAARGLAVSPDRQLITFLAPLGAEKGTDVYAVRPDGTDLHKLVTHTEVTPPATGGEDALTHENQAIKSYAWLDGSLYSDGYRLDMLFTCGTFSSPSLFRGGFLYSAKRAGHGALLDPSRLDLADAEQIQIVHLAYSPKGKVALTGYYNLHDNRVEALAGLWTADVVGGNLTNLAAQPIPSAPDGIADLQWSADGNSLIYRETVPQKDSSLVSKYEGDTEFRIVRLDTKIGQRTILYDTTGR